MGEKFYQTQKTSRHEDVIWKCAVVSRSSEPAAAVWEERARVWGQEQGEGRHDGDAQQDERATGEGEQRPQTG